MKVGDIVLASQLERGFTYIFKDTPSDTFKVTHITDDRVYIGYKDSNYEIAEGLIYKNDNFPTIIVAIPTELEKALL